MRIISLNEKHEEETKNFMFSVLKDDFGYEYNPLWHKDIVELHKTYRGNNKCKCYICLLDRQVVGTIAARPYDRDYSKFRKKYNSGNTLGIWRHYIRMDLRGRGIGTVLLKNLEEAANKSGYKYLYLHTQKSIPRSLEYWVSKGYKITWDTNDEFQTVHLEKKIRR